ncbi:uncharacterized protein LOC143446774 [Clavelina lepadiformis]|uniref:uncharacterized protein LOC143446774 n=1 Tax=Clavelina lepadiformis TaxID=159417 RepID=UPI00404276B9
MTCNNITSYLRLVLLFAIFGKGQAHCPSACKCEGTIMSCQIPAARNFPQMKHTTNFTVLDLSENNILNIPPNSLKHFPHLEELILDGNKIYFLENGAFKGCPKLRKLSMPENNLYMIEDEVFSDLPNLEELYLAKNKISELPKLQSNPKLKKFCISYNTIDSVPTGAFKENNELAELKLSANKLSSLPRGAFPNDVSNYVTLNLVANNFREIPEVVKAMTQLTSLSICHNPFRAFRQDEFLPFKYLRVLSMTNVGLDELPSSMSGLVNLEELYAGRNKIRASTMTTMNFSTLTQLTINDNEIENLQGDAFRGTPMLKTLDLSKNKISDIDDDVFSNLPGLTELNLQDNRLTEVPKLPSINLQKLNFAGNSISVVDKEKFGDITSLSSLVLSRNNFTQLSDVKLSSMVNLQSINISFNNISQLEREDFTGLSKLTTLNLRGNSVTEIDDDVFANVSGLENLHLCHNSLKQINPNALRRIPQLEVFTADHNQIATIDEITFSANKNLKIISLKNNNITRICSKAFAKLHNLEELWLIFNQLTAPPNVEMNPLLRVLGLCNNPIGNLPDRAFEGPEGLEMVLLRSLGLTKLPESVFGNMDKIQHLHLAMDNNLTSVPSVVRKMPQLQILKLTGNPINKISLKDFTGLNNLQELRLDGMKLETDDVTKLFPALPALRTLYLAKNLWRCDCELQWFALGIDGERAAIEIKDREKIICTSPSSLTGKRIDYLRLGDFRHCVASAVVYVTCTSATLTLPYVAMLASDDVKVHNKVSYIPLDGGREKTFMVNPHKRKTNITDLTPDTPYMTCVTTQTTSSVHGSHDVRETCFRFKTLPSAIISSDNGLRENTGIQRWMSIEFVVLYAVLGGVLTCAMIVSLIAVSIWCRRSKLERENNYTNVSSLSGNVSCTEESRDRNGGCSSQGKRQNQARDNGNADGVIMTSKSSTEGYVNSRCVVEKDSRTKF